jgi:putative inorganic carbon (HCO3(-)) transporter
MAFRAETVPASSVFRQTSSSSVARRSGTAEACVLVFFFIFWANIAVVVSRFHGVPQVIASGVVVLLFIPFGKHIVVERQSLAVTPVLPLTFAFLGALFLSAALSKDPGVSSAAVITYLTEGLLLYLLVSNAVRTTTTLRRVVWTLILAGSFLGGLSVYQEVTHTYANDYGGLAQVDRLGSGGGFNVAPDDAQQKVLRPRLGGPLGSENRYAQILAAVFPLALLQAFRGRNRRHRLAAAVGSLLITGGVCLTFSRGAAVALAATLAAMLLLRELRIRHLLTLLAILATLVVVVVPDYITRLGSLGGLTSLSSSDSSQQVDAVIVGRQTENLAAWNTFLDHPIAGVGPGVYFKEYSREYANRLGLRYLQSERRGHSLYLELAADTGVIGVGAFLAMVGTALVLLYRSARQWRVRDPERALLASSFFFSLFAYLACAVFLHLSYQRYFWGLLGLASAAIWALRSEAAEPRR